MFKFKLFTKSPNIMLVVIILLLITLPTGIVFAAVHYQTTVGIQSGADRLVALQNNDGGWDWPLDNGNPDTGTALNTLGPIGKGLAQAYLLTEDPNHEAALAKVGTLFLTKTVFGTSDGYLAYQLDQIFGVTTYTTHIINNFYNPLAAGTYIRNSVAYDTAEYVNFIRQYRTGSNANLATWDLGIGLVSAAACGADTTEWIAGVKAEINELDGSEGMDYDVLGLAGGIYGLAYVGEDFDPTAGEHAAASSLADLAVILETYQINNGGFAWHSNYVIPDDSNESVQNTAYAILALYELDQTLYWDDIMGAADYIASVQLPTGGWEDYTGGGENNEVTAEALWGVRRVFNSEIFMPIVFN